MKKSFVILLIVIGVLIVIGAVYSLYLFMCEDDWCYHYEWQKERRANLLESTVVNNELTNGQKITEPEESALKELKPVLHNFGVNIEPLNKQTNKAGNIIFTKKLLFDDGRVSNDKAFIDFGSKDKYLKDSIGTIEYWFFVPLKTQVKAPISGKVGVSYFEHTKDWGINIYPPGSEYIVSFEHLVNLNFKDGEIVNVGEIVGEAAPRVTFNYDIAMVELAVWKGGSNIFKFCPFDFLEESLKLEYTEKINTLASEWEDFTGKDVYKQEEWVSPGCLVDMIVEV